MGTREMILVLLAVVLFTKLAMVTNKSILAEVDQLTKSTYILQATNLAQRYMDEVDAKLYSKSMTIDQISTNYGGSRTVQPIANDMIYSVAIAVANVDSLGTSTASTTNYRKMTVTVMTTPSSIQSVTMTRLYRKVD
ncbi:MAG TPA: hypothetical protein PLE74_13365 [Candidatus Cloacimonadota bacterium]|nr:hypothetical protein [Candidatus Cloacimonadota bacterium]HPT73258.1 hypothetical protein [Candidatus Cloacimonadota bacterium]